MRRYSPTSPVSRSRSDHRREDDDYFEEFTADEHQDDVVSEEGADRAPAWKAPRELKRRLWFQKKKLAKEAKKQGGQGRGGGGAGRGGRNSARPGR